MIGPEPGLCQLRRRRQPSRVSRPSSRSYWTSTTMMLLQRLDPRRMFDEDDHEEPDRRVARRRGSARNCAATKRHPGADETYPVKTRRSAMHLLHSLGYVSSVPGRSRPRSLSGNLAQNNVLLAVESDAHLRSARIERLPWCARVYLRSHVPSSCNTFMGL